jgi:hypothetical protein
MLRPAAPEEGAASETGAGGIMGNYQSAMAQGNPDEGTTLLEIRGRAGEVPRPFPVIVQELSAGVVTLEVEQSMLGVNWDNLTGCLSTLRLPAVGNGPRAKMEGMVSWVRHAGNGESRLILGLELADHNKGAASDLRAPRDLKVFWDNWEKLQVKQGVLTEHRTYILGLLLMLGGMILVSPDARGLKFIGLIVGLSGCLVISASILRSILGSRSKSADLECN